MRGHAPESKPVDPCDFDVIGSAAVSTLAARQMRRQAIQFLALRQIATDRRQQVGPNLLKAMNDVVEAPPEVNKTLFRLPHIHQWCLTLRDFLLFNLQAEGVLQRLEIHAVELRRLLLSARVKVQPQGVYEEELFVHPSGSVHLPGSGWMAHFPPNFSGQRVSVRLENGRLCRGDGICNQVGIAELWSTDMLVRRPGSRTYTFPQEDEGEIGRWRELIEDYAVGIAKHWPEFHLEISYLLQGIVAVETPNGETHLSGTFSEVPGAIYLSWADSLEVIKEAITHELFHTRLNLLIDSEAFDQPLHNRDLFWAPWRFQVRPTIPFIHGVYAHYGMMLHNFLVSRLRGEKVWRPKLATHLIRLAIAEVQWTEALATCNYPPLLVRLMDLVFGTSRQVFKLAQSDLRDQLLVAAAGEMGELQKYMANAAAPVFCESIREKLSFLLRGDPIVR